MKSLQFLFFPVAIFIFNSTAAQTREQKSIDSLTNLFIKNSCFNGDMLVTVDNKPIYERAVGYRDSQTKEKLVHNSIFNIGSISKPFTSVAILQLQEKKLLTIEDNVKKHIPEFPYDSICIKHLLSHTSGLKGNMEDIDGVDLSKSITNDSIVSILIRYKPGLIFLPGSDWGYSNLGYDLLAVIIERVAKIKFADYMRQNIFIPAGMNRSFIPGSKNVTDWLPASLSKTELLVPHMFESIASCEVTAAGSIPDYSLRNDYFTGSSNMYSTVTDLMKFDAALRNNRILSNRSQELAYTPFVLTGGDTAKDMRAPIPSYYGLGWFISIDKSRDRIIWHKGRSLGSRSVYLRNPAKKQTVAVTDNYDYAACDLKGIAFLKIINHQPYRNPILMSLVQKFGCGIYTKGFENALVDFKKQKDSARQNYYISEEEMIELADKLAEDKRLNDALLVLNFCKELYPTSSAIFASYANISLQKNDSIQAIENYKLAVALYSRDEGEKESFLNTTGYVFLITNRTDHAELVLKLNTILFPNSCNAYDSYASALEINNKLDLAIINQEKAVAIATEHNDKLLGTFKENLEKLKAKKSD
jgi:CubicO group peptidase (beta-lactamase class C family)